jgi:hypothetical protein
MIRLTGFSPVYELFFIYKTNPPKELTMKLFSKFLSVFVLACVLAANLALIHNSPVQAMSNEQGGVDDALKKAYTAEQNWLGKQQAAIDKANQVVAEVQKVIDAAASHGKDVSSLQAAVTAFNGAMLSVNSNHQNAANILTTHNGFDGSGAIVGWQAARQTVMDARRALGEAHMTLTKATWDLRDAIRNWKNANSVQG